MKIKTKNYLLLITIIALLVGIDRLLLFYFGLPLWEWDEKLHYKHRPNITRYWESFNNKPIIINEYGQYYESFPIRKKENELRILNLGDSITMDHGVTRDETYSKYLENILSDSLKNYQNIRAINTGVQGYSTFQELEVLKRDTVFHPDIVTIGFCLNDITEPFAVNKSLGGSGLDYHRVTEAPNKYLSYFINETGFGRLIQEIRIRKLDAKQEKLAEIYDVKKMLINKDNPTYKAQWKFTLNELTKIYSFCKIHNLKVILLIFPFTFQFNNSNLSWAQNILIKHASINSVPYVNFLETFEKDINSKGENINKYFLDEDHFTPLGHRYVASKLSKLIISILKEETS